MSLEKDNLLCDPQHYLVLPKIQCLLDIPKLYKGALQSGSEDPLISVYYKYALADRVKWLGSKALLFTMNIKINGFRLTKRSLLVFLSCFVLRASLRASFFTIIYENNIKLYENGLGQDFRRSCCFLFSPVLFCLVVSIFFSHFFMKTI